MGTSALTSLGTSAMFASYAALQTTGNNIANASVKGYSRQTADLATTPGQYSGSGFFGRGVDVAGVTRAHDIFLTREAATTRAIAAMDQTRYEQLAQLESIFPVGEQGLGYAAGQFLNSMVDMASLPQDPSAREVVLTRANEVAQRFGDAASKLDSLQSGVITDLQNSAASVNQLARGIADLNGQIAALRGWGQAPNDLLDQRDQMISALSQYLQVSTIEADDGSLGVFIAGGQRLVLGSQASEIGVTRDPLDGARAALGVIENGVLRVLPESMLAAGSMTGLLRFQNSDLAEARSQLGQLATALSDSVNKQQSLGLDLRSPAGSGAAMFAVGSPQVQPAFSNARDASGSFVAGVALAVSDASQLQASDYELQADPATAGQYLLTRRSDGLVRSIASGDTVDGMTITVGAPAPAASDRFLLQPVSQAAAYMRVVLDDPRGLAAASPVELSANAGNSGTATVASLTVVSAAIDPELTTTIAFNSASGDYDWAMRDRSSGALVSSGSGVWRAGQPIALGGFELTLNGVPASGDQFTVAKTAHPASSNGNALALVALRDQPFVGRQLDAAGVLTGGRTVTDAYAGVMTRVGVRVQSARTGAQISSGVAAATEQQRSAKAGVNLDEEAARLIQFQQSYQAAAKVLQVAQSIFDTLLQTVG